MKLSPRLLGIANMIKKDSLIADIGTDHGYLPVYLLEEGIIKGAIAADINKGPLDNAKTYIEKKGYDSLIKTRLGDGIKVLKPGEVDTVIIAGMGGVLIGEILKADKKITNIIKHFILQPITTSEDLRRYLISNDYKIIDENLVREGDRIYEIIHAVHGSEVYEKEVYYEIGKKLIEKNHPLLGVIIEKKIVQIKKILDNIKDEKTINSRKRYEELTIKYNSLMEVYNKL